MKTIRKALLLIAFTVGGFSFASAQSQSSDLSNLNIPEGYHQEQGEQTGVASYTIDEPSTSSTETESNDGSGSWRQYSSAGTEELQIYSGKQNGNNSVKKVEVKVPESSYDSPY